MSQDETAEILGTTFNGMAFLIYGGLSFTAKDSTERKKHMMFLIIPIFLIIMYYVIKHISLLKKGQSTVAFDWGYASVTIIANGIAMFIITRAIN